MASAIVGESELETICRQCRSNEVKEINLSVFSARKNEDPIRDEGIIALASALEGNTSVLRVRLYKNEIGDKGALKLAEVIANNASITVIELTNNIFTDIGAAAYGKAMLTNKHIKTIWLRQLNLSDKGVLDLADALLTNDTLKQILLSSNKITDEGAIMFAKVLEQNGSLEQLDLERNEITDAAGQHFLNMLWTNHTLKKLGLENNHVDKDTLQLILKLLRANNMKTLDRTKAEKNRLKAIQDKEMSKTLAAARSEIDQLHKGLKGYVISGAGAEMYNGIYLMDPFAPAFVEEGYIKPGNGTNPGRALWRMKNNEWHLTSDDYKTPQAYVGHHMPISNMQVPAGLSNWSIGKDDWKYHMNMGGGGGKDPTPAKVFPIGNSAKHIAHLALFGGTYDILQELQASIRSEEDSLHKDGSSMSRELYSICIAHSRNPRMVNSKTSELDTKRLLKVLEAIRSCKEPAISAISSILEISKSLTDAQQNLALPKIGTIVIDTVDKLKGANLNATVLLEWIKLAANLPATQFVHIANVVWSRHKKLIEGDQELLKLVLLSFPLADEKLKIFSKEYFPSNLTASSFIPIGSRWCLKQISGCLKSMKGDESRANRDKLRGIVRRFIEMQVVLSEGLENELASIVEETESIHREAFRTTLTEVYKEHGCRDFLKRSADLSERLTQRFGEERPHQTTTDLDVLYQQNDSLAARYQAFVADVASKSGGRLVSSGQKSMVRVEEKVALKPHEDARKDYSTACDIERHGIVYGNTSQISFGLQNLQACDSEEANFTPLTKDVFGDKAEDITIVRVKDRFGAPNSSFYSDLMVNIRFANDHTKTIFELQIMHNDLTTIRLTGSHEYYGVTRSCRELLERKKMEHLIPDVDLKIPNLPSTLSPSTSHGDLPPPTDWAQRLQRIEKIVEAQDTRIKDLENMVKLQAAQLKGSGEGSMAKGSRKIKKRFSLFR